jgi:hypothetical protein
MCKSCVSDIAKTQMVLKLKTLGSGGGEERTDCDASGRHDASGRGMKVRTDVRTCRAKPS